MGAKLSMLKYWCILFIQQYMPWTGKNDKDDKGNVQLVDNKKCALMLLLKSELGKTLTRFNPEVRSGAILLGYNDVIIKSHGNSDAVSFAYAVKFAVSAISEDLHQRIDGEVGVGHIE
ncbi:hypothetical protein X798_05151 [Onchocerca flexuosa]|uniref:Phosphate acyltransferase n=1 Tax=Onchocerca flexuosa TaxID=387005 RepID=A0A238BR41_9BILA|nr:hypothetical protein X798_05151 [Onchocerca flexuosa]